MTLSIISFVFFVIILGFVRLRHFYTRLLSRYSFANEYRNKFVELTNKYFQNSNIWGSSTSLDSELYVWLTMNVNRIQSDIGYLGVMDYIAPFQTYRVKNYHIIINTLPKFRDGKVSDFDINSVDDCLLRYLGFVEEQLNDRQKKLRNPIIWFRVGVQELISIPILLLKWFGIFNDNTANRLMSSFIYKITTGIIAFITLISSIVTIIQGKEQTISFIKSILGK